MYLKTDGPLNHEDWGHNKFLVDIYKKRDHFFKIRKKKKEEKDHRSFFLNTDKTDYDNGGEGQRKPMMNVPHRKDKKVKIGKKVNNIPHQE